MRKVLSLSIFLILLFLESAVVSVGAQNYMEVYRNNGNRIHLQVQDLDSILFSNGGEFMGDHEYVDLGLSVKWATCNVGANVPYEYGDYYAWGETETKNNYDWSTYKYCMGRDSTMTKYCNYSYGGYNGFIDNKTNLEPNDDVAHVKWGGNWRMPTREDMNELLDANNCKWVWKTSPVPGYKVTSLKEGYKDKYIFLPATGMITLDGGPYTDTGCYYWTSSLKSKSPSFVYILIGMNYNGNNIYRCDEERRFPGLAVLPVCP